MRRWWLVLFALLPSTPVHAGGSVQTLAGQWTVRYFEHCRQTFTFHANQIYCSTAGSSLTDRRSLRASSMDGRHFTFTLRETLVSPGMSGQSPPCNPQTVYFDGPMLTGVLTVSEPPPPTYTWRCRVVSQGTGFFRLGRAHIMTFWIAHETAMFSGRHGTRKIVDPWSAISIKGAKHLFHYPRNTGLPALPGSYNGNQLLRLLGERHAYFPRTYQVYLTVRHHF